MSGHRLLLSRPVAERLLARAGVAAPWPVAPPPRAVRRLGPLPGGTGDDPDLALARLGALVPDPVDPEGPPTLHHRLRDALAPVAQAAVRVEVDLAVPHPGGHRRLHSWQWPTLAAVAALSTTGSEVELVWHPRGAWAGRLSELPAALWTASRGAVGEQAGPVEVPARLLIASGAALRAGRPELVPTLAREVSPVPGPDLRRLHECRARLRVLVTGPARARWVGWVLVRAGWRELAGTGQVVRLTPVRPEDLGPRVEHLVAQTVGAGR